MKASGVVVLFSIPGLDLTPFPRRLADPTVAELRRLYLAETGHAAFGRGPVITVLHLASARLRHTARLKRSY